MRTSKWLLVVVVYHCSAFESHRLSPNVRSFAPLCQRTVPRSPVASRNRASAPLPDGDRREH